MAHLRVTSPTGFDYYWTPAGAHTSYRYGFEGSVRRCVLDAAIKAGKGEDMDGVTAETENPKRRKKSEADASDGS